MVHNVKSCQSLSLWNEVHVTLNTNKLELFRWTISTTIVHRNQSSQHSHSQLKASGFSLISYNFPPINNNTSTFLDLLNFMIFQNPI